MKLPGKTSVSETSYLKEEPHFVRQFCNNAVLIVIWKQNNAVERAKLDFDTTFAEAYPLRLAAIPPLGLVRA